MDDQRGNNGLIGLGNPLGQAGAQIMGNNKPLNKQDPQTNLYLMEHALSESMYIKDMQAAISQS